MLASQLIQDLEWLLCESEMLVSDRPLSRFFRSDWLVKLAALKQSPEALVLHMQKAKSHFLGTYFEQLFGFALAHFTTLDIIAEHTQISSQTRTLGEVDVLARDEEGKVWQFEIALKFYLERMDLAPNEWIGPNKNDSLYKKVTYGRTHQLQLLGSEEGQAWLHSVTDSNDYYPNLLIYGRRFWHFITPDQVFFDERSVYGGWLYLKDLLSWQGYLRDLCLAEKPCWMTANPVGQVLQQIDEPLVAQLSDAFTSDVRPKLFSCKWHQSGAHEALLWLFICPDNW